MNRYEHLIDDNQAILELQPASIPLRVGLARQLKKDLEGITFPGFEGCRLPRVLEIGIGEGELTKYILRENSQLYIDAVDISENMIRRAKKNLAGNDITFYCADAAQFFGGTYHAVVSRSTIHNFPWDKKIDTFKTIYRSLKPEGVMLLADMVYPDDSDLGWRLMTQQVKRNTNYLPPDVAERINAHEQEDYGYQYRMEEAETLHEIKQAGFSDVEILDRIERHVLLRAVKG